MSAAPCGRHQRRADAAQAADRGGLSARECGLGTRTSPVVDSLCGGTLAAGGDGHRRSARLAWPSMVRHGSQASQRSRLPRNHTGRGHSGRDSISGSRPGSRGCIGAASNEVELNEVYVGVLVHSFGSCIGGRRGIKGSEMPPSSPPSVSSTTLLVTARHLPLAVSTLTWVQTFIMPTRPWVLNAILPAIAHGGMAANVTLGDLDHWARSGAGQPRVAAGAGRRGAGTHLRGVQILAVVVMGGNAHYDTVTLLSTRQIMKRRHRGRDYCIGHVMDADRPGQPALTTDVAADRRYVEVSRMMVVGDAARAAWPRPSATRRTLDAGLDGPWNDMDGAEAGSSCADAIGDHQAGCGAPFGLRCPPCVSAAPLQGLWTRCARKMVAKVHGRQLVTLIMHPYLGRQHLRIGEAKNPGPLQSRIDVGPVQYKDPAQIGFHGAVLPGGDGGGRGDERDLVGLSIVTCNATAWGPLRRYLRRAKADIILAQEHHLGPAEIPAKSAAALRMGWHAVFAPAQPGEGSGWKAGVAIFARPRMGLSLPRVGGHIVVPHRAVAACIEPQGYRPTTVVSLYLEDGKGVGRENLDHLGEVGKFVASQGDKVPFVVGGDFQCAPDQLAATGVASNMEGEIVASGSKRGTCRSARAVSEIDYFLISKLLAAGVDTVATVEGAGTRPHVPVELVFKPRLITARSLVLRQPPRISTSRVYGPLPPPPCWARVAEAASRLVQATRRDDFLCDDAFDVLYERMYEDWSDLAECELEAAAEEATELPKHGLRGRRPQMRWRSILPERPPAPLDFDDDLTDWRNLANLVAELRRAVWACSHGEERDADAAEPECADDPRPRDDGADDMEFFDGCQIVDEIRTQLNAIGQVALPGEASRGGIGDDGTDEGGDADAYISYGEAVVRTRAVAAEISAAMRNLRAQGAADQVHAHRLSRQAAQLESLSTEVTNQLDRMAAMAKRQHEHRWREWIQANLTAGARHAHRFLRLPEEWRPTTLLDPDGVITAAPTGLIAGYADKYNGLWNDGAAQSTSGHMGRPWQSGGNAPLERPTPADIRAAARTFSTNTAVAYDGFAMRHYEWLSDGALNVLADIIELVERTGKLPPQLGAIAMPLLGKPRGGHRAVATFVSLYRLWGRLRRDQVRQWEDSLQRPYFAAGAGKSPVDAVWRQAAQAEAAVAEGEGSATVLWDLAAFFESIKRTQLWYRAKRLNFPMTVAAVAFNAYGAARLLSLGGVLSRPLIAENGIPAGCGFAMALTKAYVVEAFDRVTGAFAEIADIPPILNVYVDDIAMSANGPTTRVIRSLTDAHTILRDEIEGPLACKIEHTKAAVVASSRAIVKALRGRFGRYAGPGAGADQGTTAAANLGIDFAAGSVRRTHGPNSRRNQRMARLRRQLGRVARLRTVAGSRTKSIFVSGPLSAATYGAAVNGVTDAEALRLRRAASYAFTPRAKGRSLGRLLLIMGIPTWKAEVSVVLQYAQEVWRAVLLGPARPVDGQLTLPGIDKLWRAVGTASIIKDDGRRRNWGAARGPISAVHLTLHRIGWTMDSAFNVTTDRGDAICLTKTSPKLLQVLLHDAVTRKLQREVGVSIAANDDDFTDRRAAADHIAAQLRSDKRLSGRDRAAYMSVACNAVMTRDRASRCGYLISNLCAKCGKAPDTHFHRVWKCQDPEAVAAREAAAPEWLRQEAERLGGSANKTMWETGLIPHPGDRWPRPSEALDAHYEWCGEGEPTPADRGRDGAPQVHGKLYIDGSCTTHVFPELRRAASAVVQWSYETQAGWRVLYPVPREVPQTPQAAEYYALGLTRLAAAKGMQVDVASDCANVVADAGAGRRRAIRAGKMYAAINRENQADVQWTRNAVVRKVPAHVKPENAEEGTAREDAIGNGLADAAAKEARELHPKPPPALETQLAAQLKRARYIVRTIAAVTQVFSPVPRDMLRRPPRPVEGSSVGVEGGHAWTYLAGIWRCVACLKITLKPSLGASQLRDKCKGCRPNLLAESIADKGHHLARTAGDTSTALSVLFCVKCGSYSTRRAYGLAATCPSVPTRAGRQALKRIRSGLQPWDLGRPAACRRILGQRPMAWDASRGRFVEIGPANGDCRRRDGGSGVAESYRREPKRPEQGDVYAGGTNDQGGDECGHGHGHGSPVQGDDMEMVDHGSCVDDAECRDATIDKCRNSESARPAKRSRAHMRDDILVDEPMGGSEPVQGCEREAGHRGRVHRRHRIQQPQGSHSRARPRVAAPAPDGHHVGGADPSGRQLSASQQRHHGPPQGRAPRAEDVVMAGSSTDVFVSPGFSLVNNDSGDSNGQSSGWGSPAFALLPHAHRGGEHPDPGAPVSLPRVHRRAVRPRSRERLAPLCAKRVRQQETLGDDDQWVRPWERPPQWMYLPHLLDQQSAPQRQKIDDGAHLIDSPDTRDHQPRAGGGVDGRRAAQDVVHAVHEIRGRWTSLGADEVGSSPASGARDCRVHGISGPATGPGAGPEADSGKSDGDNNGNGDQARARLPDHTLPGGGERLEPSLRRLGGQTCVPAATAEPGDRDRGRQRERLAARNAHLCRSFADHEDRVRAKRHRESQDGAAPPQPSASERLRALRRRVAARCSSSFASAQGDGGDRVHTDLGVPAHDESGKSSVVEHQLHFGDQGASSRVGRQAARATLETAATAAAATEAWHGREPAGAADDQRQLSAR